MQKSEEQIDGRWQNISKQAWRTALTKYSEVLSPAQCSSNYQTDVKIDRGRTQRGRQYQLISGVGEAARNSFTGTYGITFIC